MTFSTSTAELPNCFGENRKFRRKKQYDCQNFQSVSNLKRLLFHIEGKFCLWQVIPLTLLSKQNLKALSVSLKSTTPQMSPIRPQTRTFRLFRFSHRENAPMVNILSVDILLWLTICTGQKAKAKFDSSISIHAIRKQNNRKKWPVTMFVPNSKIISNIKNEKHSDCLEHTSIFRSLLFKQHKTTELYGVIR